MNIAASDVGLVDPNFGDLVYYDRLKPASPFNNHSLRAVAALADSFLTMWKERTGQSTFNPVFYNSLHLSLLDVNTAFVGPIDTISTSPMLITSVRPLFSIPYLSSGTTKPIVLPPFTPHPVDDAVPDEFALLQNYPNPFNPITTIEFVLPKASSVTLRVYNALGQEIATIMENAVLEEGRQVADFDGSRLSSGVYFYHLSAEPVSTGGRPLSEVKKMVLIK